VAGIKRCYEVYIEEGRAKRYYRDTWAVSREKAVNNCLVTADTSLVLMLPKMLPPPLLAPPPAPCDASLPAFALA
jgi:hypothetical protein